LESKKKTIFEWQFLVIFLFFFFLDLSKTPNSKWEIFKLRYFNPIGAHESGEIGDDQQGIPNNLLPYIEQVAIGQRKELTIFGDSYDTPDGTCLRDYIHVVDLALGHISAIKHLKIGCEAINLGTNKGISVKEIVAAFEKVNKVEVKCVIGDKRDGDIAVCFADCSKAKTLLNWTAERSVETMVASSWQWRQANPNGMN